MSCQGLTRNEIIESNRWLVLRIVRAFIKKNWDAEFFRKDLRSAAYMALIQAVDTMLSKSEQVADVEAFLATAIRRAVSDAFANESLLGPKKTTLRALRKAHGSTFNRIAFDCDTVGVLEIDGQVADLREQVDNCCETQFERDVVRLRAEGKTDAEVAERLGANRKAVERTRKAVEKRFDESCLALGA